MSIIFLAGRHGHLRAHDGRVDDSTHTLFSGYTRRGWSGFHLGPLTCTGSQRAISLACPEDLDAFIALCGALRASQPGLTLGVELLDEPWELDLWRALMSHLDWSSVSWGALVALRPLIEAAPPAHLCLDVPVDVDAASEELLLEQRAQHDSVMHLVDRVHIYHGVEKHEVGGSERASARLVRVAAMLGEAFGVEVLVSGRIKHGEDARRVLDALPGAWAGMRRGAWALPDVLMRDARGELGVYCTGCMACEALEGVARMECALHFSHAFLTRLRAEPPEAIQIIGASYEAMTLALEAARAGVLSVELFTLGELPGGMMRLRGRVPQQAEHAEAALTRFEQCKAHPGILMDLEAYELDTCIERLGATPGAVRVLAMMREDVEGNPGSPSHPPSSTRHDAIALLLRGSAPADRSAEALWVVCGDTLLAAECALFIRMQWRTVWWVGESLAGDTLQVWQRVYRERLSARGVKMMTRAEFMARDLPCDEVHVVEAHGERVHGACARGLLDHFAGMRCLDDVYEPVQKLRHIERFDLYQD